MSRRPCTLGTMHKRHAEHMLMICRGHVSKAIDMRSRSLQPIWSDCRPTHTLRGKINHAAHSCLATPMQWRTRQEVSVGIQRKSHVLSRASQKHHGTCGCQHLRNLLGSQVIKTAPRAGRQRIVPHHPHICALPWQPAPMALHPLCTAPSTLQFALTTTKKWLVPFQASCRLHQHASLRFSAQADRNLLKCRDFCFVACLKAELVLRGRIGYGRTSSGRSLCTLEQASDKSARCPLHICTGQSHLWCIQLNRITRFAASMLCLSLLEMGPFPCATNLLAQQAMHAYGSQCIPSFQNWMVAERAHNTAWQHRPDVVVSMYR